MPSLLLFITAALGGLLPAGALLLDVPAGVSRCLQEVLSRHDLVKGAYKVEPRDGGSDGERTAFEIRVSVAAAQDRHSLGPRGDDWFEPCADYRPRAPARPPPPPPPDPPYTSLFSNPSPQILVRSAPGYWPGRCN